jgi:hypothetical protein
LEHKLEYTKDKLVTPTNISVQVPTDIVQVGVFVEVQIDFAHVGLFVAIQTEFKLTKVTTKMLINRRSTEVQT